MVEINWEIIGFILTSSIRIKILNELNISPNTPTNISKKINFSLARVSNSLNGLKSKDLVICLTPDLKVGRIYSLTELGIKYIEKVNLILES